MASTAGDVDPVKPIKVFFISTSLGHSRRGIESFFRECFDAMHGYPGLDAQLYKGSGPDAVDEHRLWCLPKFGVAARVLSKVIRRNAYVVEQLSFLPALVRRIRRQRPDIIYYSDINLAMRLEQFRDRIGVPFKLLYSNGAPVHPPFDRTDHVQQVTPAYYDEAMSAGEPGEKHTLVPYGIQVPAGDPVLDPGARRKLREDLGLPVDRPIVLSVGWISKLLKRMDYLIAEVAAMPPPRPFVVLLGEIDDQSPPVIAMARERLGEGNYAIRSVPYPQVAGYYQAADVFTLASLREGFGRVYLEALMHGLPCVVNDHAVMRYVLGEEGTYADLSRQGAMAAALATVLQHPLKPSDMARRREHVRGKFGWDSLRPAYFQMFQACMGSKR